MRLYDYDDESEMDRLLNRGFGRLPIDDECIADATEKILLRAMKQNVSKCRNVVSFKLRHLYAIAASLLIAATAVTVFIRHMNEPDIKSSVISTIPVDNSVAVIASTTSNFDTTACGRENVYSTTDQSQLLLGIGSRTRTVIFEKTTLKVLRVNISTAAVKIDHGMIAVDVKKNTKDDSITIITPYANFTNVGTRFSVFADSVHGAGVEVFSGTVRATDREGNAYLIHAGSVWRSTNAGVVTNLTRSVAEVEHLANVFEANKFKEPVDWNLDYKIQSSDSVTKGNKGKRRREESAEVSELFVVDQVRNAISESCYTVLDSLLMVTLDRSYADTIYDIMLSAADRKHMKMHYSEEEQLRSRMANCDLFSVRKREAASAALLLLHKKYLRTPPATLLALVRIHRETFVDGTFNEDMGAEEAAILTKLGLYHETIECLEFLLKKYPKSSHGDYWRYTYATMLREHGDKVEALDAYEMYILNHPRGAYLEDAMYWTVDLSHSLRLRKEHLRAKNRYLQSYPSGRWVEEIKVSR
ncbi:MAG: FecR domain-containing protein [Chitinispirillaceae bacterium]|nr:FecR domain-containing protein [Chitinispirillaceae bacterium]